MDRQYFAVLTADIVAAHVADDEVSIDQVADLAARVHGALAGLQGPPAARPEKRKGKVSVRASVRPDHLVCLECGREQTLLKRHLAVAHDLTPDLYRSEYGLSANYPMVSPDSSERRRAVAQAIDLGGNPRGAKVESGAPRPRFAGPKKSKSRG